MLAWVEHLLELGGPLVVARHPPHSCSAVYMGREDVIMNDRRHGYCLRDWIEVVVAAQEWAEEGAG